MKKIEVAVLDHHDSPAQLMMFLAKLTQRGHKITCMDDLRELLAKSANPKSASVARVAALPHGSIKRFAPITVAIVGASRRFLAQARTHQVGFNYVSASLQYSDYSGKAQFVVPYNLLKAEAEGKKGLVDLYIKSCEASMDNYAVIAKEADNDTAGYAAPQGLRNILIMQANHQAWAYFIMLRGCNRNTVETQYVTLRIWEELLKTPYGKEMFQMAGPNCLYGKCREGNFNCGEPLGYIDVKAEDNIPRRIIDERWPLLNK
jgi:thymidylate synthase (FAD)